MYLRIDNHYIPIIKKTPDHVFELPDGEFELIYDEGLPTEYRLKKCLKDLRELGEIVNSLNDDLDTGGQP